MRELPASDWLAVVYCLVLRDTKDAQENREKLDEYLTSLNAPTRETWGLLPSHQREMARAAEMGRRG